MYLNILLLPLLSSIVSGFFGRFIGRSGAHFLSCALLVSSAILGIVAFFEVGINQNLVTLHLFQWINSELLVTNLCLNFDSLTVSMLLPVLIVSSLVHIYSVDYMASDPHSQRFFSFLSLFTFSMLILVCGDSYLLLFVGWELIGVSSYLLINFWFTRLQANKSSLQAMMVNRVGDYFLSLSFLVLIAAVASLDFTTTYSISPYVNTNLLGYVGILFLLAAAGKSAQIGLHAWLPNAMEGPTPVSALIHAATMITAGVYLLIRSSLILTYAPTLVLYIITVVGSLTAFFAASTGLFQSDIKRVIAYSTMSQLGYMVMAVGLSHYNVALYHLINHAWAKALLFLSAGAVLHSLNDIQDMRKFGALNNILPFTYSVMIIGSLTIMAFPWLGAYYSKDFILELAGVTLTSAHSIAYWLGSITAGLTAFYSVRLLALTFLGLPNSSSEKLYSNVSEVSLITSVPLITLAIMSIFFGYYTKDTFIGAGSDFFNNSVVLNNIIDAEGLGTFDKWIPTIFTLSGGILALIVYLTKYSRFSLLQINSRSENKHTSSYSEINNKEAMLPNIVRWAYEFFQGKWYYDIIVNHYVIGSALKVGLATSKILDRGLIELLGPYGLTVSLTSQSKWVAKFDEGSSTNYATIMVIAAASFIALLFSNIYL
jgi:NADH-ubiquinone oxidoreductase chain 5